MVEWPTPSDLEDRYIYSTRAMERAVSKQDSVGIQFYAGQLSVLGLFVDEDELIQKLEERNK